MATLSIPKNYADGTILFESDLDDIRTAVEDFINVTKLNVDNLQNDGITGSDKLVDASVNRIKQAAVGQQVSSASGITIVAPAAKVPKIS